jgi:hypothetical protein
MAAWTGRMIIADDGLTSNPWSRSPLACMKLDHITIDHASTIEGSSAANTNNALRTLRRMLKKAHQWQLISSVPVVKTR